MCNLNWYAAVCVRWTKFYCLCLQESKNLIKVNKNDFNLSKQYKVRIKFSKLCREKLYDKNLGAIMIEPERQKILYAPNCWKMHFPMKMKVFRDT